PIKGKDKATTFDVPLPRTKDTSPSMSTVLTEQGLSCMLTDEYNMDIEKYDYTRIDFIIHPRQHLPPYPINSTALKPATIAAHHPDLDIATASLWLVLLSSAIAWPPTAGGTSRPGKLTRPGSSGPAVRLSPFLDVVIFQGVLPATNKFSSR
ncbi:2429_t:CDS:2, partial [Acaulospora colombiana]